MGTVGGCANLLLNGGEIWRQGGRGRGGGEREKAKKRDIEREGGVVDVTAQVRGMDQGWPLSNEYGTDKTVKARFRP